MRKLCALLLCLFCFSCSKKSDPHLLKMAATPVPQGEMLQFIQEDLKKEYGIELKIIEVDDYLIPNRSLAEKEVDANFFQHIPFMQDQIAQFHYPITCYAKIHLEPMGIYSLKIKNLSELKNGDIVAVPNDPTNEYRALALLQAQGIIQLKKNIGLQATSADIISNPKKLRFQEIDAPLLSRSLKDVAIAAIPTNFALQADLNPRKNALAIEDRDVPYVNIIAIRTGEEGSFKLEALKKLMLSYKMREFILNKYQGALIPILADCTENAR